MRPETAIPAIIRWLTCVGNYIIRVMGVIHASLCKTSVSLNSTLVSLKSTPIQYLKAVYVACC